MRIKFLILSVILLFIFGCEKADEPVDQVDPQAQEAAVHSGSAAANSTTNATANPELETNTRFNFMSDESYHRPNGENSDQEKRLSGSATGTSEDNSKELNE